MPKGEKIREYWNYKREGGSLSMKEWFSMQKNGGVDMNLPKQKVNDILEKELKNEMASMREVPSYIPETNPFGSDPYGDVKRILPESDLELAYSFTIPKWGDDSVNPEFKARMKTSFFTKVAPGTLIQGPDGVVREATGEERILQTRDQWGELNFINQDMPLGNYDRATYDYVTYMWALAGAYLKGDGKKISYPVASSLAMQMGAIPGTSSLGRGGFLRKVQNTLFKEEKFSQMEVKKNSILSRSPKDGGGYQ